MKYKLHSKNYREGESTVKKTLPDLALPLHVVDELLNFLLKLLNVYGKKVYQVNITLSFNITI
jgi:hypothetical protein